MIPIQLSESCSFVFHSLRPHGQYSPWTSPGQNTGVGSCSFLQGIFPTQGLNPGLPHCRQILYHLSQQGSPRTLEWIVYPFSSRSCRPRNQTGASCIAGNGYEGLFVCLVFNFLLSCKDLELYSVDSRKSAKFSMQGNDISRFKTQKDNSRNLG